MTETPSDLIVVGAVGEVRNNSGSLDLKWELRPATVSAVSGNFITVVMDGDANVTPALSLVGSVGPRDRVHIIQIPPSGNYIVGFASGGAQVQMASFKGFAAQPQSNATAAYTNVLQIGGTAVTETFYKQRSASRIAYNLATDAFVSAVNDTIEYAFLINGTDYSIASSFFNAASDHRTIAGASVLETLVLPAGEYSVTLRWRNPIGTQVNMDNNSQIQFQLYEVAPLPT